MNTTVISNLHEVVTMLFMLYNATLQSSAVVEHLFFTALHRIQTRSSDENSVSLSVCLSVSLSVRQTRDL